jgi:hypothetical protein
MKAKGREAESRKAQGSRSHQRRFDRAAFGLVRKNRLRLGRARRKSYRRFRGALKTKKSNAEIPA